MVLMVLAVLATLVGILTLSSSSFITTLSLLVALILFTTINQDVDGLFYGGLFADKILPSVLSAVFKAIESKQILQVEK
jgi:hypothetical protein